MTAVTISPAWITDYTARCQQCGWVQSDRLNRSTIKRRAAAHAKQTGHTVRIVERKEVTIWPDTTTTEG